MVQIIYFKTAEKLLYSLKTAPVSWHIRHTAIDQLKYFVVHSLLNTAQAIGLLIFTEWLKCNVKKWCQD